MGRRPFVPAILQAGPFTVEQAMRAGLTRNQLESRCWKRVGPGAYAWTGLPDGPLLRLAALHLRLPPEAAFSGRTAAWLHGLDLPPSDPVEVTIPPACGLTGRVGMLVRRARLAPGDVVSTNDLRTTSILRTVADLSVQLSLTEAVVAVDSALRLRLLDVEALGRLVARRRGARGVNRLRRVAEHVEPASESPMETRLRMLLVLAGLPRPLAQIDLEDAAGSFVGRADLYYPSHRLAIEYDGGTHRESLLEDNRRQNRLLGAGYRLLRFASGDVLRGPDGVVAAVRAALGRG